MFWLISKIWLLLIGAFAIGALTSWWAFRANAAPARAAVADPDEPLLYAEPLARARDDLTQIIGVEAETQSALNAIGVYYLSQIASWSEAHMRWVEAKIGSEGRIRNERWSDQAASLIES
jgi:predicted flap endonuclease-1-like 5' DNA nuclease